MAITNSDVLQVQNTDGAVRSKTTATLFRDGNFPVSNTFFIVNRSSTNYKCSVFNRYTIKYDDKVLVNRSGVNYSATGETLLDYMWQYPQSTITTPTTVSFARFGIRTHANEVHFAVGTDNDAGGTRMYNLDGSLYATIPNPYTGFSNFGFCFASDSNSQQTSLLFVGAPNATVGEESSAGTVVYYATSSGVTQVGELTASSPESNANFGSALAYNSANSLLVVGEPRLGSFFGNPPDNRGRAQLFVFGVPFTTQVITPSDPGERDLFGCAVAANDSNIFIGAEGWGGSTAACGAVYRYTPTGTSELKIVNPDDGNANTLACRFGSAIDVTDDFLIVGAPLYRNGDDRNIGAAFLFQTDGTFLGRIDPPTAAITQYFGSSVSIGSGRIVIGAVGKGDFGSPAAGALGNGAVYVYDYNRVLQSTIQASDGVNGDAFGVSCSINSGGKFIVGAKDASTAGNNSNGKVYYYN